MTLVKIVDKSDALACLWLDTSRRIWQYKWDGADKIIRSTTALGSTFADVWTAPSSATKIFGDPSDNVYAIIAGKLYKWDGSTSFSVLYEATTVQSGCCDDDGNIYILCGDSKVRKCIPPSTTFSIYLDSPVAGGSIYINAGKDAYIARGGTDDKIYKCAYGQSSFSDTGNEAAEYNSITGRGATRKYVCLNSASDRRVFSTDTDSFSEYVSAPSSTDVFVASDSYSNLFLLTDSDVYAAKFGLTYNGNGNTGGSAPTDAATYLAGDGATVASNSGALAKSGFTFGGWNTAADGTGTHYDPSDTYTFTLADRTLYAEWVCVVTYDANGATSGTPPTDANKYQPGADVTAATNSGSLAKTDYVISGWNTAADGSGTHYDFSEVFEITGNLTLFAEWTDDFHVVYHENGAEYGAVPVDPNTYDEADTAIALGNTGYLSIAGEQFANWNTAADGSGTTVAPGDGVSMAGGSIDLYAIYAATTGEFPRLIIAAAAVGLWTPTTGGTDAKTYYDAAEALRTTLYGADGLTGILSPAYIESTYEFATDDDRDAFLKLWSDYDDAARHLQDAITSARETVSMTSTTAPTGLYTGQLGQYLGKRYRWSGTAWVSIDVAEPKPWAFHDLAGLPAYPDDPAGTAYASDWSSGVDGWVSRDVSKMTISVASGRITSTRISVGSTSIGAVRDIAIAANTFLYIVLYDYSVSTAGAFAMQYRRTSDSAYINVTLNLVSAGVYTALITAAANQIFFAYTGGSGQQVGDYVTVSKFYLGTGATLTPPIDNSGNGHHLTANALIPVVDATAPGGRYVKLNGQPSYLSGTLSGFTTALFLSFPFYLPAASTTAKVVAESSVDYTGQDGAWALIWNFGGTSGRLALVMRTASGEYLGGYCTPTASTWYYGAIQYNQADAAATALGLYLNGALQSLTSLYTGATRPAVYNGVHWFGARAGTSMFCDMRIGSPIVLLDYIPAQEEINWLAGGNALNQKYTIADWRNDRYSDDDIIQSTEKSDVALLWAQYSAEYTEALAAATALSVSTVALTAARDALYAYLYTTPAVLATAYLSSDTTIVGATYDALWTTLRTELGEIRTANGLAQAANAKSTAIAAIPTYAPEYLGAGQLAAVDTAAFTGYTLSAPVFTAGELTTNSVASSAGSITPHTNDTMLNYAGAVGTLGVYKWTGSVWTQTGITGDQRFAALEDIYRLSCLASPITISEGNISIESMVYNLFAQYLKIGASLRAGGYDRYGNKDPTLPGVFLSAVGVMLANKATFEQLKVDSGECKVEYSSPWTEGTFDSPEFFAGTTLSYPTIVILDTGELLCVYNKSTGAQGCYERVRNTAGVWGSETQFSTTGYAATITRLNDGRVLCVYINDLGGGSGDFLLHERIRDTTGEWSDAVQVDESETARQQVRLGTFSDGTVLLVNVKSDYSMYEMVRSVAGVWSSPAMGLDVDNVSSSVSFDLLILRDDTAMFAYRDYSGYELTTITRNTSAVWGSPSAVTSGDSVFYVKLTRLSGGDIYCIYRQSDTAVVRRIYNGSSWSAASQIFATSTIYLPFSIVTLENGNLYLVCNDDGDLYEVIDNSAFGSGTDGIKYSPIGAGIIDVGNDTNGHWEIRGDDSCECRGWSYFQGNGSSNIQQVTITIPNEIELSGNYTVTCEISGYKASAPSTIFDFTSNTPGMTATVLPQSATAFIIQFYTGGGNFDSAKYYIYHWRVSGRI